MDGSIFLEEERNIVELIFISCAHLPVLKLALYSFFQLAFSHWNWTQCSTSRPLFVAYYSSKISSMLVFNIYEKLMISGNSFTRLGLIKGLISIAPFSRINKYFPVGVWHLFLTCRENKGVSSVHTIPYDMYILTIILFFYRRTNILERLKHCQCWCEVVHPAPMPIVYWLQCPLSQFLFGLAVLGLGGRSKVPSLHAHLNHYRHTSQTRTVTTAIHTNIAE
jgi:hypothetical protein